MTVYNKSYKSNNYLCNYITTSESRASSVGIATGYWLDGRGAGQGQLSSLFSIKFRPALGLTKPPIQCVSGVLSPGVKLPERVKVKNGGATPPHPHACS
jgi:hypothetical protein